MAAAIPALKFAAPYIVSGIGSLIGKKKKPTGATPPFTPDPRYTQPLADFAGSVLPQAQQGLGTAMAHYQSLISDPEALARLTASSASDLGKYAQQQFGYANRNLPRSGASAAIMARIPQQVQSEGLRRQIETREGAAGNLANLGLNAGQLGAGVFGNLLGNQLGAGQLGVQSGYLDLAKTQANRDWYGKIGGGIFDVLTGSTQIGKNSPLGKLGGLLGMGGSGRPNVPVDEWSRILR